MPIKLAQSNISMIGDQVVITVPRIWFEKKLEDNSSLQKGNAQEILSLLDKYRGVLPQDFPNGPTYIKKLRNEMTKEWEERIFV